MNTVKINIAANLKHMRTKLRFSQEDLAEKIGVTRQAIAKWENGESLPDIINCEALADVFDVSLNDLVRHDPEREGHPINPKNKHIFGTVTIGERGQIVLPKKSRDTLNFKTGDTLVVLGDTTPGTPGIALVSERTFLNMTDGVFGGLLKVKEEE